MAKCRAHAGTGTHRVEKPPARPLGRCCGLIQSSGRHCSFQGVVQVAGRVYCRRHAVGVW